LDIQEIIAELKNETERLSQAIAALEGANPRPIRRMLAKPPASANTQQGSANKSTPGGITEEKRRRMSESMKKSWAARRKKA
jgi:hypothetical protein